MAKWFGSCIILLTIHIQLKLGNASLTYYVTALYNTSNCPIANACYPLNHYLQYQESYFRSNTTFHFFEGRHSANQSLFCNCVSNITLTSNSTNTVIDCKHGGVGFHFLDSNNTSIESIEFINCGGPLPHYPATATLSVENGFGLSLLIIKIHNSTGHGFLIQYSGNVFINNSQFGHGVEVDTTHKHGNFLKCNNHNSILSIENTEIANFNNTGLEVILQCNNTYSLFKNVTWKENTAPKSYGGNMGINIVYSYRTQIHIEDCRFESGVAKEGGGLSIQINDYALKKKIYRCDAENYSNIAILNSNFTGNVANKGGGVYIKVLKSNMHCKNAIIFSKCYFIANSINQTVHGGGVALHSIVFETVGYFIHSYPQSVPDLNISECAFSDNMNLADASVGGTVLLKANTNVVIANTVIENNNCTGIIIINSNAILKGNVAITHNNGSAGGGMLMAQYAKLYISPFTTVTIAHNRAQYAGGGIYVADNGNAHIESPCFFQFHCDIKNTSLVHTAKVHLTNNSAIFAGHQLYGGSISFCYLITNDDKVHSQQKYYKALFHYDDPRQPSYISSNPERVCYCKNYTRVHCSFSWTESHYPGERFNVSVAVVGQKAGIRPGGVTAAVKAEGSSHQATLDELQNIQSIKKSSCANLQYTINSNADLVTLILQAEQPGDSGMTDSITKYRPLKIIIKLKDCPLGFQKINKPPIGYQCNCVGLLLKHNITCDITHTMIQRQDNTWIGYSYYHELNDTRKSVVFYSACPNNYCKPGTINITSNENVILNQDEQCAFNRSGILCGGCEQNLSAVFGSSECIQCTNFSLFLILAFASAGIMLVFVLHTLNLTVSEGTIHGLLFYANIVQANVNTFFPTTNSHSYLSFLKGVIAWINLDLGIKTCFYSGMDTQAKALLQFAFPLYIWSISGTIIFLSRRSFRVSRLIGKNAVKVLATLILLSYAKLLRAVLDGFTFAILEFNDAGVSFRDKMVWQLDGNIPFANKKHILLLVTSLIFALVMLPFTATLLFIQPLQRYSHRSICCHIQRLMPIYDAYTGAYKYRSRFWPGLLLLTRVIIFIFHAANFSSDPRVDMMVIILCTTILLVIAWLTRQGIYRRLYLDILEALSIINLGILCSIKAYNVSAGTRKSQAIETSLSVSIALVIFASIVCYHIMRRFKKMQCWENMFAKFKHLRMPVNEHKNINENTSDYPPLRRFDEEREPLLGLPK